MSDHESKSASTEGERTPEEIREEIDETREELGDTVAAATEKTDVKKQAKAKAKELGDKAKAAAPETPAEGVQQARSFAQQNPAVAVAGALVGLLVLWRLLRR